MAGINHIKNYFNKIGPLGASVDFGSIDIKNPTDLQNFQEALGAPSLSNYFKVSMDLAPSSPTPRTQFPIDGGGQTLEQIQAASKNQLVANNLDSWLTSCGVFRDTDKHRRRDGEAEVYGGSWSYIERNRDRKLEGWLGGVRQR